MREIVCSEDIGGRLTTRPRPAFVPPLQLAKCCLCSFRCFDYSWTWCVAGIIKVGQHDRGKHCVELVGRQSQPLSLPWTRQPDNPNASALRARNSDVLRHIPFDTGVPIRSDCSTWQSIQ